MLSKSTSKFQENIIPEMKPWINKISGTYVKFIYIYIYVYYIIFNRILIMG